MARSIAEIEEIIVEKAQELIPSLTSTSKAAVWRLWAYVVAYIVNFFEQSNDQFKLEVEALAANKQVSTLKWYQLNTLSYLHGKDLVWNTEALKFEQVVLPTDDVDLLQVVKYCSVVRNANSILIKTAKGDEVKETLSATELDGLVSFWDVYKEAGDDVQVVSRTADDLRVSIKGYYDAKLLDGNGNLISDSGVNPLRDAFDAYFDSLDFNGKLVVNDLLVYLKQAEGIVDVEFITLESRFGFNNFEPIDRELESYGGYFAFSSYTAEFIAHG